jgi:hypothetical protein
MSDEIKTDAAHPEPPKPGERGEHPLSVLLFSWMRTVGFYRGLMAVLAAAGAVLVAVEFVAPRHGYLPFEGLPGFFGVFGFLAFGLAVLSGWPLGKLLRRPEDYYERDDSEEGEAPEEAGEPVKAKEGGDDD